MGFLRLFSAAVALALGLAWPSASSGAPFEEDEIHTLAVGTIDLVDLDFVPGAGFIIGNRHVMKVEPGHSKKQLAVTALKKGSSSLLILGPDGQLRRKLIVKVITSELSSEVMALQRFLERAKGLYVYSVDDLVFIDGKFADAKEARRVDKLAKAYGNVVVLAEDPAEDCARKGPS